MLNLSTFIELASSSKTTRAASQFVIGAINLQRGMIIEGEVRVFMGTNLKQVDYFFSAVNTVIQAMLFQ